MYQIPEIGLLLTMDKEFFLNRSEPNIPKMSLFSTKFREVFNCECIFSFIFSISPSSVVSRSHVYGILCWCNCFMVRNFYFLHISANQLVIVPYGNELVVCMWVKRFIIIIIIIIIHTVHTNFQRSKPVFSNSSGKFT